MGLILVLIFFLVLVIVLIIVVVIAFVSSVAGIKNDLSLRIHVQVVQKQASSAALIEICRGLFEQGINREFEVEFLKSKLTEILGQSITAPGRMLFTWAKISSRSDPAYIVYLEDKRTIPSS